MGFFSQFLFPLRVGRIAAAAAALFVAAGLPARGDNLLGNLPQTNDNGVLSIGLFGGMQFEAAVKFTTPGIPYILDDIQFRLSQVSIGGPPVVTIRADDVGGDEPGTLIATLTNPALGDGIDTHVFTPNGVLRLEANTTYWFLLDHGDNSAEFLWHRSSPTIPPAGIATFDKIVSSNDDGATYVEIAVHGSFQINASEVVFQPDLSIGDSDKPQRAKKNDVYNITGAGQKRTAKPEGRKKEKEYLFVQNDGNDIDTITLHSTIPRKKLYRLKIFRLTGGKINITGAVRGAGFAFPDLTPGERIVCLIELKGKRRRGNHTVEYTGRSTKAPAKIDVNLLKVRPRA